MQNLIPLDINELIPKHKNLTEYDTLNDKRATNPRTSCSPGWAFAPGRDAGKVHFMSCKRRSCNKCGKYWSWKWRKMLEDKALSLERQGLPAMRRALTLTTAYDPGFEKMRIALSMFWKELRKLYPGVQYWGVTEYNQQQTQPHFHFILSDDCFIPHERLQELWEKVQRWANFDSIAWNVSIEEIKDNSDIQRYFTKYLTKLTGGKNEIPDREKWKGRFVRYSRKFFPFPTSVILMSLFLNRAIENDDHWKTYYQLRPKLIGDYHAMDNFVSKAQYLERKDNEQKQLDWQAIEERVNQLESSQVVDLQLALW